MTTFELEVAANAAARDILALEHEAGTTAKDQDAFNLAFASARRSRMLDAIVKVIEEAFSVHVLASSELGPSPEVESVRHSEDTPLRTHFQSWGYDVPPGLQQTQHWRKLRHAFDNTGIGHVSMFTDRPCLKCGMTPNFENHFSPSGEFLQPAHAESTASDEAAISGEANP